MDDLLPEFLTETKGREENPVNLDPRMAKLAGGVHRLDGQLMVVLDVDRVLEITSEMLAA
jgi:purine-binding chemotaxis protein CheW